jgi:hypothetical protein
MTFCGEEKPKSEAPSTRPDEARKLSTKGSFPKKTGSSQSSALSLGRKHIEEVEVGVQEEWTQLERAPNGSW